MSYEVEKRYLLSALPKFPAHARGPYRYDHGFLPGTTIKERVTVRPGGYDGQPEPSWKRTVKIGTGVRRFEFAEDLNYETFSLFWAMTYGRRISAQRWKVDDLMLTLAFGSGASGKSLFWEVTEFLAPTKKGDHLVLCELELPESVVRVRGEQIIIPDIPKPEWLAPFIVNDVTDDATYENFYLAR